MTYQSISEIFQHYNSDISVAEAHGIATAMLCVDGRVGVNKWLEALFDADINCQEQGKIELAVLFERSRRLLNFEENEFEFDLLLPENDDLQEQAIALSEWCQGFLWGIGYSDSAADWSGETTGILKDMLEFTKLEHDIEDGNNEDEEAFMQLHQYLRAAVFIIRDELSQNHTATH